MQHQSQFARSFPGAAAKGRRAASSSRSPASQNQQQTWTDTERGLAREVLCPSALAVAQDWSAFRGRAGFIVDGSPHLAARHSTTRAGRPFVVGRFPEFSGLRGCVNTHLANIKTTRRGISQCVSQRRPSHFRVSVPFDSHDANENGLTHAQIPFAPGAKAYD